MVCILPTTEELDAAMIRADRARATKVGTARPKPISFEAWCDLLTRLKLERGPLLDAAILGEADARLLADAFDFAMQHLGCPLRAVWVGF